MVIDTNAGGVGKNRLNVPSQPSNTTAISANESAGVNSPSGPALSDSVSLSGTAKAMSRLEHKIAQDPAIDRAKVDEIKQSINNGSYSINPNAIADKILSDF